MKIRKYIKDYLETKKILKYAKRKGYVIETSPDHWVLTEKGDKEWEKEIKEKSSEEWKKELGIK